jgi:cation:H+ antiporter
VDAYTLFIFVGGLVLLVGGAEWLVRGASALARALGISPLVVGLTVVAFGTSAPELGVSITAALAGESDLALGNVVGSNIANILLILGMSAAVAPLIVSRQLVRREVPLMVALSVGVTLLALDGQISRVDGALLTTGVVLYVVESIRESRREQAALVATGDVPPPVRSARALLLDALRMVTGLAVLMAGTHGVVGGATAMAAAMGVGELLIGLTIVALGTSLPEGATSIVATLRGERDLAVGNAVGSNILNLLAILGLTALVRPIGVPEAVLAFDLPMMIAVAIACLPVFFTGGEIARWEGLVFLGYYVAYLLYLVLDATNHGALPTYHTMMVVFVAPLTGLTLAVLAARHQLRRKEGTKEPRNQG